MIMKLKLTLSALNPFRSCGNEIVDAIYATAVFSAMTVVGLIIYYW